MTIIDNTDRACLLDRFAQIDKVEAAIADLEEQIESTPSPYMRKCYREQIKMKQAKLRRLRFEARGILSMIQ